MFELELPTMATWKEHIVFFLLLLFFSPSVIAYRTPDPSIRGGYWPTWTFSYSPPSSIDRSLFTHLFYAFVQVESSTFRLDVTADDDLMLRNFSASAHSGAGRGRLRQQPVKALLSIGGGGSNSAFSTLSASASARAAFIDSTIAVARRYDLDGLDLDWEFPQDAGAMANLATLLLEWRAAAEREAASTGRPRLLLTAAVYFASRFFLGDGRSYPVSQMAAALDWVNLMCYDFRGSWDTSATGEHAAWYDPNSNISGSYGVDSWVAAGMPRRQVVLGMPLYGRTWKLRDAAENGVGAPAVGVGPGDDGVLVYSAVEDFNRNNSATVVHDRVMTAAYSYAGTSWIGYDDSWSAATKVRFARRRRLGGYFFWAIGYDDSRRSVTRAARSAWG
ncbi:LOW QUALITY PROTEIN: nod factor hydrolase protein 1-like [Curcuma longa]|uniref:LOW QUALITY PROTEIN: nod factor hydrolase protein 1-like n=1 Tax=Curcuma longa TaxID=136217 RepID=UPI003D9FAF12